MTRLWIILLILLTLSVFGGGAYLAWNQVRQAGFESCALSIEDAFGKALNGGDLGQRIVTTDQWRTLEEHEERLLFDKLISIGRTFDCHRFPEYSDGTVFRGDNGVIRARREGQHVRVRIEVIGRHKRLEHPGRY